MSEVQQAESRPDITVVTAENFNAYVDEKLAQPEPEADLEDVEVEAESPEDLAAKEFEQVEAERQKALEPKEGDTEGSKVYWKGKWVNKSDYSYRMHIKTENERVAKEEAAAAKTEAQAEREAKRALEARVKELQDKYEPPKPDIAEPEPLPSQFTDVNEYAKALKEWTADNTRREDAQKQAEARRQAEQEQVVKEWNQRQEAAKKTIPDYADKIANSSVKVSDQMKEAILESEIGPQILYHLAENPELADKLGTLPVGKMLREFGKLEASLNTQEKPQAKGTSVAEISRAPAPISPLKGSSTISGLKIDSNGEWYGTFEEYKVARSARKIR